METAELTAIGVAARADVHGGEAALRLALNVLGQEDEPGASAEHGQARLYVGPDWVQEVEVAEQLGLRGRLAAGQHQSVLGLVPVGKLAHLEHVGSEASQHALVLNESPLKG